MTAQLPAWTAHPIAASDSRDGLRPSRSRQASPLRNIARGKELDAKRPASLVCKAGRLPSYRIDRAGSDRDGEEHAEGVAGTVEPALHRADGDADLLGDLLVGAVFHLAHHERD